MSNIISESNVYQYFLNRFFLGFKITSLEECREDKTLIFNLEPTTTPRCPKCGSYHAVVHQYKTRTVKVSVIV